MSLAQLKDQAVQLQPEEQRELIAFLIANQNERDEDFKDTLARKIGERVRVASAAYQILAIKFADR